MTLSDLLDSRGKMYLKYVTIMVQHRPHQEARAVGVGARAVGVEARAIAVGGRAFGAGSMSK